MTSPAPASGTDGKVLALLGAGPGLGAALGRRFGREGYRVALVARRPGPLEAVAAGLRAAGVKAAAFPPASPRPTRSPK
jgi:NADP-dependent 3-hydroxy acid dehydrogenase YdfG